MQVLDVIRSRRSIRAYADMPVEQAKTDRILEAARLAPSAANRQAWRFIVVTDRQRRRALAAAAMGQDFVAEAPLVIVACAAPGEHHLLYEKLSYAIDVTVALTHMTLQAVAEGLGTCWVTGFYEDQVRRVLSIPNQVRVVQMLTVGYPAGPPRPLCRKPLDELVHWETWSDRVQPVR